LLLFLPFSNNDDEAAVDDLLLLSSSSEYALIVVLEFPTPDEEEKEISDGSASSVLFVLFRSVSYANERDDRLDSVNRFVAGVELVEANIGNGDVHADASS
jgi:hypothetical protein